MTRGSGVDGRPPLTDGSVELDGDLLKLEAVWNEFLTAALRAASAEQEIAVHRHAAEVRGIEQAVATISARSLRGLAFKLRLINHGLKVGPTELEAVLCASALADIDAMLVEETVGSVD